MAKKKASKKKVSRRAAAAPVVAAEAPSEFEVQSGIPMPISTRSGGSKYPLAQLKVGDMFFVPDRTTKGASTFYAGAKKLGIKVSVRPFVEEDGTEGIGVWRTE